MEVEEIELSLDDIVDVLVEIFLEEGLDLQQVETRLKDSVTRSIREIQDLEYH